jgi:hypothetical protein
MVRCRQPRSADRVGQAWRLRADLRCGCGRVLERQAAGRASKPPETLAHGFIDGIYQGVSAAVRILGGWRSDSTKRPQNGYLASGMSRIGVPLVTASPTLGGDRRGSPKARATHWAERRADRNGVRSSGFGTQLRCALSDGRGWDACWPA